MLYGLNIFDPPQNSNVEALTANVMIFRNQEMWGVIKVKLGHEGGAFMMGHVV